MAMQEVAPAYVAPGGLSLRRRFERSRLQEELFEAVYDTLLAVTPAAVLRPQERPAAVGGKGGAGVADERVPELVRLAA